MIANIKPIPSTNWSLIVVVSESEVLAALKKLQLSIEICLLISIFLIKAWA
jgi:hypothetical protein